MRLNFTSSGTFLFSFRLIKAGVLMMREFGEETSSGILLTPFTCIESIELAKRLLTYPKFLLKGFPAAGSSKGK